MKAMAAGVMAVLTLLLGMMGCGKTQIVPTVPEEKTVPGALIGIHYSRTSGMIAGYDFEVRLNKDEIEYTSFYPGDMGGQDAEEKTHIPITEKQWSDVETVLLDLSPVLEELESVTGKPSTGEELLLDGGDHQSLSLVWQTEEGTEEIGYRWPSDRRVLTLIAMLQELADPIGREIPRYEPPELCKIYFTRDHRINRKRDYSFQLHWTAYEEDPHWELIYYLGPGLDGGRVGLEQADWDAFLTFAEATQLEYFPEPTKNDKRFTCTLTYTDGTYKNIVLNDETEQQLKQFFFGLIEQKQ